MNLEERIKADFIAAYKSKEMNKKNFLGVVKGEIETLKLSVAGGMNITDKEVMAILMGLEKSIRLNTVGDVLTAEAERELDYLAPYLPKEMSNEELTPILKTFLEEVRESNPNMNEQAIIGKTIGLFNSKYKGQAKIPTVKSIIETLM